MLKRWQELAEPSLSSCLESIPGVYTRAEILHELDDNDDDNFATPHNELEGSIETNTFILFKILLSCCYNFRSIID